jgi:hypothetical protein
MSVHQPGPNLLTPQVCAEIAQMIMATRPVLRVPPQFLPKQ